MTETRSPKETESRVVPYYACKHGTPGGCAWCSLDQENRRLREALSFYGYACDELGWGQDGGRRAREALYP